jgi:glucokinase
MPGPALFLGVDVGGTKTAAALVDATGTVLARQSRPTPRDGGAAVLAQVVELVAAVDPDRQARALGVGSPGVVRDGTVTSASATLPGWAGTPVQAELERRLGLPVVVDNDVNVAAAGEVGTRPGLARADVLFVSVGTGVGGALLRAGRLEHGPHGTAGEIAHLLVPATGALPCGCGRLDHLEAVASGPGIAAGYGARTGDAGLTLQEVAARASAGDATAAEAIAAAATLLGRALAGLVAAVDVDAVVLGGGVAQLGEVLRAPVADAFAAEALPPLRRVPVTTSSLGTSAPLVGAALLAAGRTAQLATVAAR